MEELTRMNILLLPCHSILEYDEFRLFQGLGHNVFSTGAYVTPRMPQDSVRPPIDYEAKDHAKLLESLFRWPCNQYNDYSINPTLIGWADVIIIHGFADYLKCNLSKFRESRKRVIYRTIGQSTEESWLKEIRKR